MERKDLKRKIMMILCLGALMNVYGGIGYAEDEEIDEGIVISAPQNAPITYSDSEKAGTYNYTGEVNISEVDQNYNSAVSAVVNKTSPIDFDINVNLKNNVRINAGDNYALFSKGLGWDNEDSSSHEATANININSNVPQDKENWIKPVDKNNIVQIIGNIKTGGLGTINMSLTNSDSYFAGKIDIGTGKININFINGATWYVVDEDNTFTFGEDANVLTYGGVIDIAHDSPIKTLASKNSFEKREFTFENVSIANLDTTFVIEAGINNKGEYETDKITLEGDLEIPVGTNVPADLKETFHLQVVTNGDLDLGEHNFDNGGLLILDIEDLENSEIIQDVSGKSYLEEREAGLIEAEFTPTINWDSDEGRAYLTSLNITSKNKGSAHLFAETGAAMSANVAAAWRADSSDIFQRIGDIRDNKTQYGVWGRTYGGTNKVNEGLETELDYRAIQFGFDKQHTLNNGTLVTGVAFSALNGDVDSKHGSGETDSVTTGVYGSWFFNNGHFVDLVAKYGHIDNELKYTNGLNSYKGDFSSNGISLELEYGYHMAFDKGFFIEPTTELAYTHIESDNYTMKLNGKSGARVENPDYNSFIGRAGFNIGKKYGKNSVFLKFNAAHEFAGDVKVRASYNNTKVKSEISGEDTWVEYGIGFNMAAGNSTTIYGALQKTTGDVIETDWHGSIGVRYSF